MAVPIETPLANSGTDECGGNPVPMMWMVSFGWGFGLLVEIDAVPL